MKVVIDPQTVAMILAHKKIEKKYESLGFSPYEEVYENYIGRRLTKDAKIDYDKHYEYFLDILLSRGKKIDTEKHPSIH
tara:strand:+ start:172 stop:408 length:237 start_codon:yes stop_codon:yes gene_type:complete